MTNLKNCHGQKTVVNNEKTAVFAGEQPIYFNCCAASEDPIAARMETGKTESTVIPANGFFEFIPTDNDSEVPSQTLNLDELSDQ